MPMIPSYQDMLAQALQQSQMQSQQQQSTQNRSIFDNPAFGNALSKMGLTMLAYSGQGLSTGEALGQGGLAFLDETQTQNKIMRQKRLEDATLAHQQLLDNLQKLALQREAMQYDTATQQAQNLPQEYQGLASIDPMTALKQQMADRINAAQAEREFAQKMQLQNMQYGQQRSLAQEQAQNAFALKQYENQIKQEQAQKVLGLMGEQGQPQGGTKEIPPYLKQVASLASIGDVSGAIMAKTKADEEQLAAEKQLRGITDQSQSIQNIIQNTKGLIAGKDYGYNLNTGILQTLPNVFLGSEQQQLANNLESIKANATLQKLVEAKQNGVTFGALSEGELNTVATAIAKLDPKNTPTVINNALNTVQETFDKIAKNTQQDYSKRYGVAMPSQNNAIQGFSIREIK